MPSATSTSMAARAVKRLTPYSRISASSVASCVPIGQDASWARRSCRMRRYAGNVMACMLQYLSGQCQCLAAAGRGWSDSSVRKPLVLQVFPTFAVGGAQARFAAIANRFANDWRFAIVAMDGVTSCRERLDPAVEASFPSVAIRKGDTLGTLRRIRVLIA